MYGLVCDSKKQLLPEGCVTKACKNGGWCNTVENTARCLSESKESFTVTSSVINTVILKGK